MIRECGLAIIPERIEIGYRNGQGPLWRGVTEKDSGKRAQGGRLDAIRTEIGWSLRETLQIIRHAEGDDKGVRVCFERGADERRLPRVLGCVERADDDVVVSLKLQAQSRKVGGRRVQGQDDFIGLRVIPADRVGERDGLERGCIGGCKVLGCRDDNEDARIMVQAERQLTRRISHKGYRTRGDFIRDLGNAGARLRMAEGYLKFG